jgi:cytoskeletal protein RodZ
MESLGDKLRTTRTEKGISVNQVSRDTNITIRYIEALEAENFSIFPGEPYIIGFLKNYSSYLDLDVQKIISLYKAIRIQEQPVPVEQLLIHPPKFPRFIIPSVLIIILLLACGWGISALYSNRQKSLAQNASAVRTPVEIMMEGNSMERRLYRNDSVLVQLNNEVYKVELFNLGEAVTIRTPVGTVILDLSQEAIIDLDNNGFPDLRITVVDFAKNNADMGAQLLFFMIDSISILDNNGYDSSYSMTSVNTTIIPASPSAYPFTLQTNFLGYCMFRWEILNERDRAGRNQNYFQRTDELNIQAQNGIRIWTSNAQAARVQVIGGGRTFPIDIGSPGEVVVTDVRWVRDDDNRFRLVLMRLET